MIEDMCKTEDSKGQAATEHYLQRLKAGDDIENIYIMGYLKNEHEV
jgi:hypothetical protein